MTSPTSIRTFHKSDQLLSGKSDITVHSDHKPLEIIFERPLASAPHRLQSMMLTLQRYMFRVECRKGSTLHLADTISRAPLRAVSHKPIHDELVYRVEYEIDNPDPSVCVTFNRSQPFKMDTKFRRYCINAII